MVEGQKGNDDPQIKDWEESRLKWDPRLRCTFKADDRIYSLRGLRQIGKTTLIKLEIRQKLETVPKWNIVYYSFELESSPRDVIGVIDEYFDRAKQTDMKRKFMFLDEISNIQNWQQAIKKLKDQGKLKDCTVVVTGSHSMDIRHATELLPGRRGVPTSETLDKILLPMKFGEYVKTIDKQIGRFMDKEGIAAAKRLSIIQNLAQGKIDELIELSVYQKELNRHFDNYLLTGGIPVAINEFLREGFVPDSIYQTYLDAIAGNLKHVDYDMSQVVKIIPNIISTVSTPTSWRSLTKNSDIKSHHTVAEYVKILEDMFVLQVFYRYDAAKDRAKFDGNKKIYFHDSFFLHALNGLIAQKESFKLSMKYLDNPGLKSRLAEQTVANHAVSLAFNTSGRKSGFEYQSSVFYWRSKSGREVDFAIRDGESLIPIEVKYQNQIKNDDLYGVNDFRKTARAKNGIILTKNDLRVKSGVSLVPVSLFLLLV